MKIIKSPLNSVVTGKGRRGGKHSSVQEYFSSSKVLQLQKFIAFSLHSNAII